MWTGGVTSATTAGAKTLTAASRVPSLRIGGRGRCPGCSTLGADKLGSNSGCQDSTSSSRSQTSSVTVGDRCRRVIRHSNTQSSNLKQIQRLKISEIHIVVKKFPAFQALFRNNTEYSLLVGNLRYAWRDLDIPVQGDCLRIPVSE